MIEEELAQWNNRKRTLFSEDRYLDIVIRHLEKMQVLS